MDPRVPRSAVPRPAPHRGAPRRMLVARRACPRAARNTGSAEWLRAGPGEGLQHSEHGCGNNCEVLADHRLLLNWSLVKSFGAAASTNVVLAWILFLRPLRDSSQTAFQFLGIIRSPAPDSSHNFILRF